MTNTTTLLPTLLLALALGLSACGGGDGDATASGSDGAGAPGGASSSADDETSDPPAEAEPGSPEQVDAISACLADLGLPVEPTPSPTRPEQKLSVGPVTSGPDETFQAQVYVFDDDARALEERPNVTFFDEDTEFDTVVGNVLVAYYPAPSRAGGLETGIDACLA